MPGYGESLLIKEYIFILVGIGKNLKLILME
jgi:hypothetical protein